MSTTTDQSPVLVRREGPITHITLNRPEKLNVINHELGTALCAALAAVADTDSRVVVLRGAGRAFCAGDELGRAEHPDEARSRANGWVRHYAEGAGRWTTAVDLMRRLPQPVVARIQGYAYGGGLNLALGADFRVLATDAKLCAPFVKRGMATGTNLLQQYVGVGRAMEIMLLAEPITADEALGLGLATRTADPARLDTEVDRLCAALAEHPRGAVSVTKRTIYTSWGDEPSEAYWRQGAAVLQSRMLADYEEGMAAFRDKRSPRFDG